MIDLESFIRDLAYMNPNNMNRKAITNVQRNAAHFYHLIVDGEITVVSEPEFMEEPVVAGFMDTK